MNRLLPCLLLLAPAVATAQTSPPAGGARRSAAAAPAAPDASSIGVPPAGSRPDLEGFLGFRSLYSLLNRTTWPTLPREGTDVRSGRAVVGLEDPLQTVVVFNAWHIPAAGGTEDVRLADMRKHVLRRDVVFDAEWPVYALPGFIVLVQKRDREWALVARLDEGYLVEDRSGIGICSLAGP